MKAQTTQFRSLSVALKELEPFIRNGGHLQTGKPFENFGGLRSRELLANWLLCVTLNAESGDERMTFTTDPDGGDGIIYDTEAEQPYPTEHVIVPQVKRKPGEGEKSDAIDYEALILAAIDQKRSKGGEAYAKGKSLVVFLNAGGDGAWFPNRVARKLPSPLYFAIVWVVGLHQAEAGGEYVYGVTQLDVSEGNAMVWHVRIGKNFDSWRVERVQ
jgi:hypothetical protein